MTSRGQTFNAVWAWAQSGDKVLRMMLNDSRDVSEIAQDFEGLTKISRKSENEGDAVYEGYDVLVSVQRNIHDGTALLTLERSNAHD
jgi:hypothetical protein